MAAQATVPLEKAKKREPDKASIREALGIAYFRIHRYDEADHEFRAMLELSPADDYAHYALGRCLEKQGRTPRRTATTSSPARSGRARPTTSRGSATSVTTIPEGRPGGTKATAGPGPRAPVRAVVQRVSRARSTPGGDRAGLCVLLGVADGDDARRRGAARGKGRAPAHLRERGGQVRPSLLDTGGNALVVSQFTLIADTAKGTRPDFSRLPPEVGRAVVRALLRLAGRWASMSRPASSGPDAGRTRQRRPGHDRPRRLRPRVRR